MERPIMTKAIKDCDELTKAEPEWVQAWCRQMIQSGYAPCMWDDIIEEAANDLMDEPGYANCLETIEKCDRMFYQELAEQVYDDDFDIDEFLKEVEDYAEEVYQNVNSKL